MSVAARRSRQVPRETGEVVTAMLNIVRRRLEVTLEEAQAADFQKQADERLTPLISGVRREYFTRLGLGADDAETWAAREQTLAASPLVLGDLVLRDRDTIAYYRASRENGAIEAGVVTRNDPSDYDDFFDALLGIAGAVTARNDLAWEPFLVESEALESLREESATMAPSSPEVAAARELESEGMHGLLTQILTARSVFLTKFSQTLTQEASVTEHQVSRLEELGLVTKDFAVLCRKTGQQILRVSSRAAIEDPSQKTFKCFICGNSVSEEVLDEIITVSDFGRNLLERDHWLVVRALGALDAIGIAYDRVRVRQGEGALTNFFVTVNDQMFLIVVANRKLSLEESYLVNAQIAAYGLGHVVVISTQRVSLLMRQHLQQCNPCAEFDFIDSLQTLEARLTAVFARKEKGVVKAMLASFSALTPVAVQDAIMRRIAPLQEVAEPAEAPRKTAAAKPAAEKASSPPSEKGGRKGRAAKEEPEPTPASDDELPDADFSLPEEVLEVDESMMTEMPPG